MEVASSSAVRTMLAWLEAILLVETMGLVLVLLGLIVGGAVRLLVEALRWIVGAAV